MTTDPSPPYFYGALPVFLVDDVLKTAEYYRDVLGFEIDFLYGEPPFYASVSRDDAILNFRKAEPAGVRNSMSAAGAKTGVDAFIIVSTLDVVLEEMKVAGAKITRDVSLADYDMREFQVEDLYGYRIGIAEEDPEEDDA